MPRFILFVLISFTACICVLFTSPSHGTRTLPPTLSEVVEGSENIGLVKIQKAEVYEVVDAEGVVPCGIIYEGDWVDSLTGDSGRIEFVSKQVLEVRTLYLVYLADSPLPRKFLSTSTWAEKQRSERLAREQLCERSQSLPRTMYTASKFVDETHIADIYKTGTWVEFPHFSESTLTEIVVKPTGLSIDGDVVSRDQFIHEFYDENKHQVIRTAGYELIIFRAVDWSEYCGALVETVRAQAGRTLVSDQSRHTFCEKKP